MLALGLSAVLLVAHPTQGTANFGAYAQQLQAAQILSATLTVRPLGGAAQNLKFKYGKPNLAKIEWPGGMVLADGKSITRYDRAANTYSVVEQTDQGFREIVFSDDASIFRAFFDPDAMKTVYRQKPAGQKNRKGMALQAVEVTLDSQGQRTALYLMDSSMLPRQIELTVAKGTEKATTLWDIDTLALGSAPEPAESFAFSPPAGSRKLTEAELQSDKWYTNIEEAKAVAAKTKRAVFVDFYADW